MTDELSIQNQRPSAVPYIGIGGAAAGTAGYFGLPKIESVRKWMSEPAKYGSYADLINEKEDEFQKTVEAAEGEEKTLMEKAQKARQAGKEAGDKYDADLKNYLESNKAGATPELPADNELLKEQVTLKEKLSEAQKNLDDKIKQLEELEAENLRKTAPKIEVNQQAIDALTEKINSAKTVAKENQIKLNAKVDELAAKLPDGRRAVESGKLEDVKTHLKTFIFGDGKNNKGLAGLSQKQKETLYEQALNETQLRAGIIDRETILKAEKEGLETQLKAITNNALTGKKTIEEKLTALETLNNVEKPKVEKLQALQEKRRKHIQDMWNKRKEAVKKATNTTRHSIQYDSWYRPNNSYTEIVTTDIDRSFYRSFDSTLSDAEKKLMRQGPNNRKGGAYLTKNINKLEENINARQTILDKAKELKQVEEKLASNAKAKFEIVVPAHESLQKWQHSLEKAQNLQQGQTTDFMTQAKENIAKTPEKYKAETDALKVAQDKVDDVAKRIEQARATLPKNPEKTAEQLTKEFVEKNGTRESVIEKATNGFKDDLKKLFEGKLGKGKLAMAVGGAVAAGALIGLAFRPGSKEA